MIGSVAQRRDPPHTHGRIQALDFDLAQRLAVDDGGNGMMQGIGDQRFTGRGLVLQARREVDRIAGDGVFAVRVRAGAAGDDLAAGDADMCAQRVAGFVRQRCHPLVDVERGAHSAQRVVVVGDWRTKHRHDVVAHMLVDRAAVTLDDAVNHLEVTVEERMGLLGAEFARKLGVARDVGEQHGDLTTFTGNGGGCGQFCRRFVFTL